MKLIVEIDLELYKRIIRHEQMLNSAEREDLIALKNAVEKGIEYKVEEQTGENNAD